MLDLNMDPYILIGIINMQLRDYYNSLDELIEDLGLDVIILKKKLHKIGYAYNKETNQFKPEKQTKA